MPDTFHRCGFRGGYAEAINFDPDVKAMLVKSISAKLCSSVSGQVGLFLRECKLLFL